MTKKRDVSDVVLRKASVDIKLDLKDVIEEAVFRKFPEASDVSGIRIDVDRMFDAYFSLEDFWVSVDVEVSE